MRRRGGPRRGGNEDRISGLPDEMCHRIMSFLKAWEAVHTCGLSRRWRTLWSTAPSLDIRHPYASEDDRLADEKRHVEFVNNLLLRRRFLVAPLDTLRVDWSDGGDANTWVAYAVRQGARVIELSVGKNYPDRPEPEYTSFICDEPRKKFKMLKLTNVTLGLLIMRKICSSFQELELKGCDVFAVVIRTGLLKHFTMINCFIAGIAILDASPINLVSLRFIRPYYAFPLIGNSGSLVRATMVLDDSRLGSSAGRECPLWNNRVNDGWDDDDDDDRDVDVVCEAGYYGPVYTGQGLLLSLSNVTTMELMAHSEEIVMRREVMNNCPMFINLKTLTLGEWCIDPEFEALSTILGHAPNLEKLFIHLLMNYSGKGGTNIGRYYPYRNLKEVYITCSNSDTTVRKTAKFFVANGVPVKNVYIREIDSMFVYGTKRKTRSRTAESSSKQRKV